MTPDMTPAMYGCIVIALVAIAQLLLIAHLLDKVDRLLKQIAMLHDDKEWLFDRAFRDPSASPRKDSEP